MSKSLQDQLLKKGLINNKKANAISKDKHNALKNQRRKKAGSINEDQLKKQIVIDQARKAQKQKDLEFNLQQKTQADKKAIAAQTIQLIEQYKLNRDQAELAFNFTDSSLVKKILVTPDMSKEIGRGRLCIAKFNNSFEVIPTPIADKIRERDDQALVVDNSKSEELNDPKEDSNDAYYAQFEIPDDLIW